MKITKITENKKKKAAGLLGVDSFNTGEKEKKIPKGDPEVAMKAFNHAMGADKKADSQSTTSSTSASESSSDGGGMGESMNILTNKQIVEQLNKYDRESLDENLEYYDFVNLYETLKPLNNDEKRSLSDAVKTGNMETINNTMAGLQAKRDPSMRNKLAKTPTAEVVDEDTNCSEYDMLNKVSKEELTEGRHDLIAKKCISIETHHTYWSPYDTVEKDFAKFGIRYRYEDRESCLEAINDPENDLGYTPEKEKRQKEIEKETKEQELLAASYTKENSSMSLNEEVLSEYRTDFNDDVNIDDEANSEKEVKQEVPSENEKKGIVIDKEDLIKSFAGKTPSQIADDYHMLGFNHRITTRDGKPLRDIELLIAIYLATNGGDTSIGVSKWDLSVASGTDSTSDRDKDSKKGLNGTYWNDFKNDSPKLVVSGYYDNNNIFHEAGPGDYGKTNKEIKVYPTSELKPFIETTRVKCFDKEGLRPFVDEYGSPVYINIKSDIIDNQNVKKLEKNSKNLQGQNDHRSHSSEIAAAKSGGSATSSKGKINIKRHFKQNGIQEVDGGWLIIPPKVFGYKGDVNQLSDSQEDSEDSMEESLNENLMNEDLRQKLQNLYRNLLSIPDEVEVNEGNLDSLKLGFVCARCGYTPDMFKKAFNLQ